MRRLLIGAALILAALITITACTVRGRETAWAVLRNDNAPRAPFEIAPGLYYVGASDVAVYALRTSEGLILIDGGYPSTAAQVLENLRTLGLDPKSVRILLNTHAHFDHAGGLADLKRETGAQLYASAADAQALQSGGRGDFFLRDWMTYPPVAVDVEIADGDVVRLGDRALTAHLTPGHTKGCTSWSFPIAIDGREVRALLICGVSTLQYRLIDNPDYPTIAEDFERTFVTLRALPCELFLSQHAGNFDLDAKRAAQQANAGTNPFVDPDGCKAYLEESEARFGARLEAQRR